MKIDITSLDGDAAGSIELADDIFGLEPREDLIARMVRYQLAKRRAGTHAVKNRAEIARTGKKMYKQKGTGSRPSRLGPRAAVPRRRSRLRSGRALAMRMTCPRRSARWRSSTRCRPRPRTARSSSGRTPTLAEPKTKARSRRVSPRSASTNALIIDGAELAGEFRSRRAQHSADRRAAGAGHQCLRHSAPREAGADQGGDRCAGGALQMSPKARARRAPLRRDRRPGHHRKGDASRPSRTRSCSRSARRDQAADQGGGRTAVRRQGRGRQHARPQGQDEGRSSGTRGMQSDVKNAVVTLAEGHKIDVTTGL